MIQITVYGFIVMNCYFRNLSQVANALQEYSRSPDIGVDLLWPKSRSGCKLLRDNNLILIDSPGFDIEAGLVTQYLFYYSLLLVM